MIKTYSLSSTLIESEPSIAPRREANVRVHLTIECDSESFRGLIAFLEKETELKLLETWKPLPKAKKYKSSKNANTAEEPEK